MKLAPSPSKSLLAACAFAAFLSGGAGATRVADDPTLASYAAHVAAAETSLRLGEVAAARRWLDGAPAQHRGFEWNYLNARLDESERSFIASDAAVFGLDVSNDGTLVAIGDAKGRVRVFELATGAERFSAHEHTDLVDDVRFDASAKRLVSASHDRTARIWDVATGACSLVQKDHRFPLGGAAFTPDGAHVVSANYETQWNGKRIAGVVRLWDAATGEVVETFEGGAKPLSSLALSHDGKRAAAGSWDFCAFAWELATPGEPAQFIQPDEDLYNAVDCVAWNPDDTKLVYGGKDHTARIHDATTRELLVTLRDHGDDVTGVAFSPDGKRVATTCRDGIVRVFDAASGELTQAMRGHTEAATCVEFTPDGTRVVTAGADGRVLVFDVTHARYGLIRPTIGSAAYCVRFSPDGSRLAACTYDGRILVFDARTADIVAEWRAHAAEKCAITLAFAEEGKELLSCSYDGTIRRWDVETQTEIGKLEYPAGVYTFTTSADGAWIAASLMNGTVSVRSRVDGASRAEWKDARGTVYTLAFDANAKRLLAGGQDRKLRLYDVDASRLERTIENASGSIQTALFTPDGSHAVTGSDDGTVKEWELATGTHTRTLFTTSHTIQRLAYSNDGKRLAAVGVRAWILEPRSGTLLATLHAPADEAFDLEFSPDGGQLATANMDGSVTLLRAVREGERRR